MWRHAPTGNSAGTHGPGAGLRQSAKDAAVDREQTVVAAPGQDCAVSGTLGGAVPSNATQMFASRIAFSLPLAAANLLRSLCPRGLLRYNDTRRRPSAF
jgi:hypothetical protein